MSNDNKGVNKAFIQGYNRGKADGRKEALLTKYSHNQIREIMDLPPIDGLSAKYTVVDEIAEKDPVYKPTYYNDSKITPFDVIDDWELDFYLGNAVKYIKRAGKKDGNSRLQDLKKIRTYVDEEIKREEESGK